MISIVVAMLLSSQAIENLPTDCSKALTTPEVNACRLQGAQRETARMGRYLAAARTRARAVDSSESWAGATQQLAYLENSQAIWIAYSRVVCAGVEDQWKEGTVRQSRFLECEAELARERTRVIWRDYLRFVDSTPPILPEPVGLAEHAPDSAESQP